MSVFETTVEAGPPLHVHDRDDECFYVLDGELSVRRQRRSTPRLAGFVFLPRGPPPVLGQGHVRPAAPDRRSRRIEDYFDQINNASDDVERHRIGELYGIRVVPAEPTVLDGK